MAKQKVEIEVDVPEGWDIARQSVRNEILPVLPVEHGCSKQLVCGLILRKIEPVRHKRTVWLNAYRRMDGNIELGYPYSSESLARESQVGTAIACFPVTVEFTEGEGLAGAEGGA